MALTEVRHTLVNAKREPREGVAWTAQLIAPYGYLTGSNQEIVASVEGITEADGLISMFLTPVSEVEFTGAVYRLTWQGQNREQARWFTVPNTGPVDLRSVLTAEPVDGVVVLPVTGVGISSMVIPTTGPTAGHLIVTYTDASTQDLGVVNPGPKGDPGPGGGSLNTVALTGTGNAELTAADGLAGNPHLAGVRTVSTATTLTKTLSVASGGMLKPASGITVTLPDVIAGRYQIFDLSLGGTIAFSNGASKPKPEWFGVTFNDVGTGVTNGDALRAMAAMFALVGAGSVDWPMYGTCRWTGLVQWDTGVGWQGPGKSALILKAMDAAAQMYFYSAAVSGQRRGDVSGFTIDGNGVAELPMRVRRGAGLTFTDIRVWNGRVNCSIDGVQNSSFYSCDFLNNGAFTDYSLRIDEGSQHLHFFSGTVKDANLACLYVTQSVAAETGQADQPENINFWGTVIERASTGISVLIDAGNPVKFHAMSMSALGSLTGPRVKLRRRMKPDGVSCYRTSVVLDDVDLSSTSTTYAIDAKAISTASPPAGATWASAITPAASYPIAKLKLSEGGVRPAAVTGYVEADQGVEVSGTLIDLQLYKPIVVPAAGSTKVKLDHLIYNHGTLTVEFSGTGTGALVTGDYVWPVLFPCEILSTTVSTRLAPTGTVTAIPLRGSTEIYLTGDRPVLTTADTTNTALNAIEAQRILTKGDRIRVDTQAPTGQPVTVVIRVRRL